jgi:hypothetical protein
VLERADIMTANQFRRIALAMSDAVEAAHMGHPDFRANGRIFATLAFPDKKWGMVVLLPDQQQQYAGQHPEAFVPAGGAWGRTGSTLVRLELVDEETLGEVMTLAWQNTVQKSKAGRPKAKPATKGRTPEPRTRTKKRKT